LNSTDDLELVTAIVNGSGTPKKENMTHQARDEFVNQLEGSTSKEGIRSHGKRKRNGSMNKRDYVDSIRTQRIILQIDDFKCKQESLRFSASQIAAMAGFHPFTNLAKLLMDLVYQGRLGQLLLQRDAELLNIEMVPENDIIKTIAKKAGPNITKALLDSFDVCKGKKKLKNTSEANAMKDDIITKVKSSHVLSKAEVKQLSEGIEFNVNTGFGKIHENDALDFYERKCGWEITERNDDMKCWKFKRSRERNVNSVVQLHPAESMNKDSRAYSYGKNKKQQKPSIGNDKNGNDVSIFSHKRPFFSIVGVCDGIRDELYQTSSDDNRRNDDEQDNWDLRKVVIECKHRMKNVFAPPPIYDQIQAVIYAFMYNTTEAEIVQVLRTNKSRSQSNESDKYEVSANESRMPVGDGMSQDALKESQPIICSSHRVSLNDSTMQHADNWQNVILPRLRSFADAVYSVRSDDHKRYRLIHAASVASSTGNEKDWWQILFNECPWLIECDTGTGFSRK